MMVCFECCIGIEVGLWVGDECLVLLFGVLLVVYCMVQEVFINVFKYLGVKCVDIEFSLDLGVLMLEIYDNGCGIVFVDLFKERFFGICGLYECVVMVGGWVDLFSVLGEGISFILIVFLVQDVIDVFDDMIDFDKDVGNFIWGWV